MKPTDINKLTPEQAVDLLEYIDAEEAEDNRIAAELLQKQIEANHVKKKQQAAARAARNQNAIRNYRLPRKPGPGSAG